MTEKQEFLNVWMREFPTTLRVLKAYSVDKGDWKPHERSRSAKELAWTIASEEQVIRQVLNEGKVDFSNMATPPASMTEVLDFYEKSHNELVAAVNETSEQAFATMVKFPAGPGKSIDMKAADVAWMMLMDSIHHRGQFSVYVRLTGGKVPAIYGPSADDQGGM